MENKLTQFDNFKEVLKNVETGITKNNDIRSQTRTSLAVKKTMLKLMEIKKNNIQKYENIINANNAQTTALAIVNNAINGFVLGEDYHLILFKGKSNVIAEIKTGACWKNLAMRYSIKPIRNIRSIVFGKEDKYEAGGWPMRLTNVELSFNQDKSNYENIIGAYAEVEYYDNSYSTRIFTKQEIKQLIDMSPSGESKFSPWNNFPFKMVESKILRDLIIREVVLDKIKMTTEGYNMTEDDVPLTVENGMIREDYGKYQIMNKTDNQAELSDDDWTEKIEVKNE